MSENQPNDPQNSASGNPQPAPPQKPRRRRRWPWVILILLLLLVGLVALAPTIASTGAVRSVVVGKVNENLNGNVEIADWSFGWLSPVSISGIKVYDDQKRLILDIPRIKLGVSILDAARQNFALGQDNEIDIASVNVRVDENGRTNLEQLAKATAKEKPAPRAPGEHSAAPGPASKLPNLSGKFTVNIAIGTIEVPDGPPVHIDRSSVVVNIPDINKPIENTVKLAYHVGDGSTDKSTIEVSGTVDAIENNQVDEKNLAAAQKIALGNVNLAVAEPFLKKAGKDTRASGVANGSLDIKVQGLAGLTAAGQIVVSNLMFGGGPLGADEYKTSKLTIPLNITRSGDGANAVVKIENVGVQTDQVNVAVSGQLPEQALQNLAANKAPGSAGTLTITADVTDLKNLASQLRNTLKLEKNVQVDGGKVHSDVNIALLSDRVNASVKLNADARGKQGDKQIELKPITVSLDAGAIPTGKSLPDVRDLKLSFNSDFATIQGGGATLAKIDINGKFDLGQLRSEVGQFVDMGALQLSGNGDLAIKTDGDLTNENAPVNASLAVNVQNAKVSGVASETVAQDRLAIAATGLLTRAANAPTGIDNGVVTVKSGDPASPMLDVDLAANVDLKEKGKAKISSFEIRKMDASNLAALQKQYGGLVPALAKQNIEIASGSLSVRGKGSFDGTTLQLSDPIQLAIPGLEVRQNGKALISREAIRATVGGSVAMAADRTSASLSQLSLTTDTKLFNVAKTGDAPFTVTLMKSGPVQGSGQINLGANLPRLVELAQAFGGTTPGADRPQLKNGQFDGTIKLAMADKTSISFEGKATDLTVSANGLNPIYNQQLTIALNAQAPADLSSREPITASGKINSPFIITDLSDVKVALQGGVFDMLQGANVDVQLPNLPNLYALVNALGGSAKPAPSAAASTTPPQPPLEITSGNATVKLNIARDSANKTTTVNVTDTQIANLALKRGERPQFVFTKPISLKLQAAVKAASPVESILVNQLSGDLSVASLEMPAPISIKGLNTNQPSASGSVKVTGSIDAVIPLLAVLQGADPLPYRGQYAINQQLATSGSETTLGGSIDVNKFKVILPDRGEVFSEDQVGIKNDLAVDLAKNDINIKSLTVDMLKSQALGVKLTGKIKDYVNARAIDAPGAKLDLAYDLEKIWPIVKPMLSPEMQQQYKDLKIAGKTTRTFTITGALPNKPTMAESLASLSADGSLALDLLDLPQGLDIHVFELPFKMKNGVLQTAAAPAADARKLKVAAPSNPPPARRGAAPAPTQIVAATAVCNEGALNLDEITLDLTKPSPLLSISPKHILIQNVKLNPVLADSLGKIGAVILTGATKAEGLATMTVNECDQVPLGDLLTKKSNAKAQFTLTVDDLLLDGLVPNVLSKAANLDTDGIRGRIPPSTIVIANGQANTNFTIEIVRVDRNARGQESFRGLPMKMNGGVVLSTLELRDFKVELTKELVRGEMAKYFPNGAVIPLKGTANKPQLDMGDLLKDNLINSIPGLFGGGQNNGSNAAGGQQQQQQQNPLGGLLQQLGGQGGNQQQSAPEQPQQQPQQQQQQTAPRRGQQAPARAPTTRGTQRR